MTRPHEFRPASVSTAILRVPRVDWSAIIAGTKTQLRHGPRGKPLGTLPRPVVVYSHQNFKSDADARLVALEDITREPLGAISPEGLAAEGFDSLKEFRRYWALRHHSHTFNPLLIVNVYHLALWTDGDRARFGDKLMTDLYGDWL